MQMRKGAGRQAGRRVRAYVCLSRQRARARVRSRCLSLRCLCLCLCVSVVCVRASRARHARVCVRSTGAKREAESVAWRGGAAAAQCC